MNYYIDFDNTLYETSKLTEMMLKTLGNRIEYYSKNNYEKILDELRKKFNRKNIYNIYELARYFGKKYDVEEKILIDSIEEFLLDGKKYVYDDVEEFLKMIRNNGNTANLFTYASKADLSYQLLKIKGSGISDYFDNIIITTDEDKNNLNINYSEGIFIDDNPQTIAELSMRNPFKIIRVMRKNNKYSAKKIEIENLIEVESLAELKGMNL